VKRVQRNSEQRQFVCACEQTRGHNDGRRDIASADNTRLHTILTYLLLSKPIITMQAVPMEIEEEGDSNKMMVDPPETATNAASEEEEARQAIDMLRGEDVSGRVAAANRLEAVAAALGEERTREVSLVCNGRD